MDNDRDLDLTRDRIRDAAMADRLDEIAEVLDDVFAGFAPTQVTVSDLARLEEWLSDDAGGLATLAVASVAVYLLSKKGRGSALRSVELCERWTTWGLSRRADSDLGLLEVGLAMSLGAAVRLSDGERADECWARVAECGRRLDALAGRATSAGEIVRDVLARRALGA